MIPYQPMNMSQFVGQPEPEPNDDVWAQAMTPPAPPMAPEPPVAAPPDPAQQVRQKALSYGLNVNLAPEERDAIQQALIDTVKENAARNKSYQEREDGNDQDY